MKLIIDTINIENLKNLDTIIFIVGIVIDRYGKYHIGILLVSAN